MVGHLDLRHDGDVALGRVIHQFPDIALRVEAAVDARPLSLYCWSCDFSSVTMAGRLK